ncbi:MAG: ABC transporter ATP-binding protein [Candidatus Nucleicultricaceae bacterium]
MTQKKSDLQPKILLKDVKKSFGSNVVLNGISLHVDPGESLVVIGGSGSGKSVMLKCILGLLPASSGEIFVDGEQIVGASTKTLDAVRSKISMLFQGSALFDSLPVWENICFRPLQEGKITRKQAHHKAIEHLATVGLKRDVADRYPAELSGGMQRRVALARAIASEPQIIFFDEPTTGLDPIMSSVINDLIIKSVRELGASAITITHDMASARQIADRIAMIHHGKIIWVGKASDIEHSGNPYVEQFIKGQTDGPIHVEGALKTSHG